MRHLFAEAIMQGDFQCMYIYLDNAATTKPCEAAVNAAFYAMVEGFGNPSSLHKLGVEAEKLLTAARKDIAAGLVSSPECIYFTSGATEGNNLAIFGSAENYGRRKKKLVTTAIEHPSVAEPTAKLEKQGYTVVRIKPDCQGNIDPDEIVSAVDDETFLVSCMLVNNETGLILPIKQAFSAIKRCHPKVITHCDAVQAFMKLPIKASELCADVITVSGHKVHAVKGVGAVYVKKGIRIAPVMLGGGQEGGIRSGTESVPLISAFGAAARTLLANQSTAYRNAEEINAYLTARLKTLDFITINSCGDNRSPYILNFSVDGIRSEIMLHFLESKGIYVSSGSACSKGGKSKVLAAFGVSDKLIDSALRVSISCASTKGEMDALITALREGKLAIRK